MSGHIVNALVLIQLRLDIVVVGLVLYQKFNLGEIPLAVGEQLGKIDTVGVNVGIVYQGIIESLAGALPGQDNLVVVGKSVPTSARRLRLMAGAKALSPSFPSFSAIAIQPPKAFRPKTSGA